MTVKYAHIDKILLTAVVLNHGTLDGKPVRIRDMDSDGLFLSTDTKPDEWCFISWSTAWSAKDRGCRFVTKKGVKP